MMLEILPSSVLRCQMKRRFFGLQVVQMAYRGAVPNLARVLLHLCTIRATVWIALRGPPCPQKTSLKECFHQFLHTRCDILWVCPVIHNILWVGHLTPGYCLGTLAERAVHCSGLLGTEHTVTKR